MIEHKIQRNIPLAPLTTFKIGGPAKYFLKVKNKNELVEAIKWAKKKNLPCRQAGLPAGQAGLPYFILGGGSNILVSDKGFNGLIIELLIRDCQLLGNKILVGAGMSLAKLVTFSIKNGLTGLEWAVGIPGTIGGAVRGNAGALGHSISEYLEKVKILRADKIIELKNKEIGFSYRQSIFKRNQDIILEAVLALKKGRAQESKKIIKENIQRRATAHPAQPSAGCIFKNPKSGSAGLLIQQCGLKGKQIDGAKISQKHANFIVNTGQAKARDVRALIALIKRKVKDKFNIELEEEIKYIGF